MPIFETIETKGVPIKVFTDQVEESAREQLIQLAESGIAVGYVSAMPDVHWGSGATVGSVFASENFIAPNAVGVDIGCGMAAVPIPTLKSESLPLEKRLKIRDRIKSSIPLGMNSHTTPRKSSIMDNKSRSKWLSSTITKKTACQIGTLGSGNHFIELVSDSEDMVWIFLHSGSRNIGKVTAENYNKLAKSYLKRKGITPQNRDLNFLEIDSKEGQNYLLDMQWCQEYAMENRQEMLRIIAPIVTSITSHEPDFSRAVNIHHNYCSCEECTYYENGTEITKKLWITRKGATSAKAGQLGLIPGSMGTGSYLVRGKGNPESWSSCSHGAGRTKSRIRAKKEILQSDFEKSMEGIVCDTSPALRDEAPQAYKDINHVMQNQSDLVEIVTRFTPLINVKGFDEGKSEKKNSKIKVSLVNLDIFFPSIRAVSIFDSKSKSKSKWVDLEHWTLQPGGYSKGRKVNFWFQLSDEPEFMVFISSKILNITDTEIQFELETVLKKKRII
ncbi:MAG: RtcB family protein [Leptospiraceae bacterium]|nr:RtcB family protein [Leptospiraceae bacterium]